MHRPTPAHRLLLKGVRVAVPLVLLGGCWYVAYDAARTAVPPGAEEQMWLPLPSDLRVLGLTAAGVEVDVLVFESRVNDGNSVPTHARYVIRRVNSVWLRPSAPWQAQGVPERPAPRRGGLFGRSRPGVADNCSQKLAQEMLPGREVEAAVLTWQEPSPQGPQRAVLTVWREKPSPFLSLVNRFRVCVESSRTAVP